MGLWRKLAKHSESLQLRRGISRAALAGASLDELCLETFSQLQPALSGTAERFGVWLVPYDRFGESLGVDSFQGRSWSNGLADEPAVAPSQLPFPKSLLEGSPTVEQEVPSSASEIRKELAIGMRRMLWVPVRSMDQLVGVLFAGSRRANSNFPREEMERAAAELALTHGFRSEAALAKAHAWDVAEARRIWSEISVGMSLDRILQGIANSAIRVAGRRAESISFAALGMPPDGISRSSSAPSAIEFCWSAGDHILVRSVTSEPLAGVWRKALETHRTEGAALSARWPRSEVSRVVAIPLRFFAETRGVLVVGYHGSTAASLASLERLQLRAALASAAIAMSSERRIAGQYFDSSQFLLENISDAVVVLSNTREITGASVAAKAMLASVIVEDRFRRQWSRRYSDSAPHAEYLFKPAEWSRVSAWLDKLEMSEAAMSTGSLETELATGSRAELRAALLRDGGFTIILHEISAAGVSSSRPSAELRCLLEWMDEGVLLFDQHESVRAVNQRFTQLFGLNAAELATGTELRSLVSAVAPRVADPDQFAARWWDAARGDDPGLRDEVQVVRPTPRTLERISRQVFDPNGLRLGRIEIYRDLTAQSLLQSALHKSERLASLGQRLSGVAHELSNPLTTILGYTQRLLRNAHDSPWGDDFQRIFSEADRASAILRQLLFSARESPPERAPIDLNPLVLRTVDLQRFQLASDKIRVQLELAPSLPPMLGEPSQLQQILVNLIANARHALLDVRPGGTISVRTRLAESGRVVLEVSDSGPGISEADRHRIFDPFFTTKPAGMGTGLGLSIVLSLVQENGGTVRVDSAAGEGATFTLEFAAAGTAPAPLSKELLPQQFSLSPAPGVGRVLVVEDEPTVAQLISDILSDLGYSSDVFNDARRALVSALNRNYALIICDMKMPGLDGQHFYRALAEAGALSHAKFLFVTGDVLGLATQEFLRARRLPHIAKPFRLEEFAEKLSHVFGQPSTAPSQPGLVTNDLSRENFPTHG